MAGKASIEPIENFCLPAIICVGKGKSGERDEIRTGLTIRKYLGPTRKKGPTKIKISKKGPTKPKMKAMCPL